MVRLLERRSGTNVLPLFAVATFGLHLLTLLLLMFQGALLNSLNHKPSPSLVQMLDGHAVTVTPREHLDRTSEAIQRFVGSTMSLIFTWSGSSPIKAGQATATDQGMQIQLPNTGPRRVSTTTWEASFAFSEEFRKEFLKKIALMTPQDVFAADTKTQAVLLVRRLSEPEKIADGRWKVEMVASLVIFSKTDNVGKAIPLNKQIFVQAIDPPQIPLSQEATPLQQTAYRVREAGLEIYEIRDLEIKDLF